MAIQRAATTKDLDWIVSLTRAQRRQLQQWSPVYFNPREGADEGHAGFLSFLIASDDHETQVIEHDADEVGFFVRIQQDHHLWIDDLCVRNPAQWPLALDVVAETSSGPWVTCVSVRDTARLEALRAIDQATVSTYYARSLDGLADRPGVVADHVAVDKRLAARHTFGGSAFSAETPGALVVSDPKAGYLIGSPSVAPPIYDPGGMTCVVDQVVGSDRRAMIEQAIAVAANRGDAQLVVVCAGDDRELAKILLARQFRPEVLLIGTSSERLP